MLGTEERNPESMELQSMSNIEIVNLMNQKNAIIEQAIAGNLEAISDAVDLCVSSLKSGGRIIYIGAGTSGRLGVLDAVECVPTFNVSPDEVVGSIAGGQGAMFRSVEGAEDNPDLGEQDLQNLDLKPVDTVVGIAASGRTPYVIGGLNFANRIGAHTVSVANNIGSKIGALADVSIEAATGPEVLTGSTRLTAGTADKEILNMLSTISMVRIGKVYSNLMIDVRPSNEKLKARAHTIIRTITHASDADVDEALQLSDNQVGISIVMLSKHVSSEQAVSMLKDSTIAELI